MTNDPQQQNPVQLGRRSIAALIEVMEHMKNTQIKHLLFKHGLNERYIGQNKMSRLGNVFHPLALEDADKSELDNARDLCEEVVVDLMDRGIWPDHSDQDQKIYESFREALRVDGADLVEGRIVSFLSPSVEPAREQGVLESRLGQYGFGVASNHLNNALDLASRSKWEPANGEVRNFLEGVCDAIAAMIYSEPGEAPKQGPARQFLANEGFLNDKESELLRSLFQVLHGEGGHAGTSTSDDCHRRRLMAVSMANYYLERLDHRLGSNTPTYEGVCQMTHCRKEEAGRAFIVPAKSGGRLHPNPLPPGEGICHTPSKYPAALGARGFWKVENPCQKSINRNLDSKNCYSCLARRARIRSA